MLFPLPHKSIYFGDTTLAVAPEPSTYAMMLVGAGALVWFARRKLA